MNRIRRSTEAVADAFAWFGQEHLDDLLFAQGAILIAIGAWLAWPPLAFLVLGLFSMAAGSAVAGSMAKRDASEGSPDRNTSDLEED